MWIAIGVFGTDIDGTIRPYCRRGLHVARRLKRPIQRAVRVYRVEVTVSGTEVNRSVGTDRRRGHLIGSIKSFRQLPLLRAIRIDRTQYAVVAVNVDCPIG